MPSETNPEDLRSIATFEEGTSQGKVNSHSIDNTHVEADKETDYENPKKRKLSEEEVQQKKKRCEDVDMDAKSEIKKQIDSEDTDNKKKKKHKKDRKKNSIKELGLQILSKREWKKMRNRYLDLQKKKMKEYKQLRRQKSNQKNLSDNSKKPREDYSQPVEEEKYIEVATKLEFIAGVIVKLKLPEPCMDIKKLKTEIKAVSPDVKYVDVPLPAGSEEVYIRFANSESAKEFCTQEFNGERIILENEEEKLYWNKIQNDRTVKFTKSVRKQRGRDKLLKKAEKERAKHMRFDEGE
ncbi:hypothetical protein NQ314_002117 [Rhamnusium bicolor]|uniref:XRRM domain-containing protein n=1 Tax=Rhamnusium bicolor TaxID=1586634 RepID=A0AAV8ZTB5_9CUCU|nr:hypothetical protein NQ314_002117 [Rhamnusium bicolor]